MVVFFEPFSSDFISFKFSDPMEVYPKLVNRFSSSRAPRAPRNSTILPSNPKSRSSSARKPCVPNRTSTVISSAQSRPSRFSKCASTTELSPFSVNEPPIMFSNNFSVSERTLSTVRSKKSSAEICLFLRFFD